MGRVVLILKTKIFIEINLQAEIAAAKVSSL
jgi:hypothetical protein